MAEADKVTLFREFDESGFRIRVHVIDIGTAACFGIEAVDLKKDLSVHEEVCPPMKHYPRLFIHEEDLLDLEIKTEEILRHLVSERQPATAGHRGGRGKATSPSTALTRLGG